jgi:hypothetical protein
MLKWRWESEAFCAEREGDIFETLQNFRCMNGVASVQTTTQLQKYCATNI